MQQVRLDVCQSVAGAKIIVMYVGVFFNLQICKIELNQVCRLVERFVVPLAQTLALESQRKQLWALNC